MNQQENSTSQLPRAYADRERRWTWFWLVPIAAIALSVGLLWYQQKDEGQLIQIQAVDAHDLKVGDPLKYRGAIIGEIESIEIPTDLKHVQLNVRLHRDADHIAKENSSFWIVRPELSLTDLKGVDTLLGPRYLQVKPGDGLPTTSFTAQVQIPVQSLPEEEGLQIIVSTDNTASLRKGSPLLYRGIQIGTITDAKLAPDARQVDLVINVNSEYRHLPRNNSSFWTESGVSFNLGWSGLNFQTETLESIAIGGLVMATPDPPGLTVDQAHRFNISEEAPEGVENWDPGLPLGTEFPKTLEATRASLKPMKMAYNSGRIMTTNHRFSGSAFFYNGQWFTTRPLIKAEKQPHKDSQIYMLGATRIYPQQLKFHHGGRLASFNTEDKLNPKEPFTPEPYAETDPTDIIVVTAESSYYVPPQSIASRHLFWKDNRWLIHPQVQLRSQLEGAIVLSREKGELLGMLTKVNQEWFVIPLTDHWSLTRR